MAVTGIFTFLWWNQAIKPMDSTNKTPVNFTIARGESVRNIADRLQKQGLIRSSVALFLKARFGGLSEKIQAGEFILSRSMDLNSIAENLTHGTTDLRITIPEGWRKEEIALKLARDLSMPESDFLKNTKEGYMFPDTYQIPKDITSENLAKLFLDNFQKKVGNNIPELAKKKNLTTDELITIASLVEREAKHDQDRPLIASVILNRLNIGMKLDIDATVQYALGYQSKEKSWWKKELTVEDLDIDSPFNTYKNPGLPPSPIANPGLAAIKAVAEAQDTDYLYYVADSQGYSHFAKDIAGHNSNIMKYLKK